MSKLLEQINSTKTTKKLGDLVFINQSSIVNGFTHNEIEYIDTASVTRNHFDTPQILNTNEAPSRAKRLLKDGDTILSTVRPNLCHYGFIKNPKPNTVASTGFVVLTPKNIDPFYLYSYLTQDSITNTLSSIAEATTTTFPAFRPEVLSEMAIEIPDLPTQKKIAEILSAYDEKIENNNKIIKNLEATAQAIFNEWFINFRFPGYEKVKMINSEMGEIPEGWEVAPLSNIADIVMGQSPTSDHYNSGKNGLPFHQGVTYFCDRYPEDIVYSTGGEKIAEENDILISVRAPVGRINIANQKTIIGRGLSAVRSKNNQQCFLLYLLKTLFHKEDLFGGGSVFPSITKGEFEKLKVIAPKSEITLLFDKKISNFDLEIKNLIVENVNLKESRDRLLAKLI